MKVVGFMALHYGVSYISYAIRSVIDSVSEVHIAYTPVGSHGSRTSIPCPETRDELFALAEYSAGDKLRWHEGIWNTEGEQRASIFQYAPDADVVVVVDADEVYGRGLVEEAVNYAWGNQIHRLRLPFLHYWRSFWRGFPHDPAYPERIILPHVENRSKVTLNTARRVHHFGYAQSAAITEYKWRIHGHLAEMRHDVDWFQDIFLANRQTDCHPVGSEWWNAEDVDPFEMGLPSWMTGHPYATLEVIP